MNSKEKIEEILSLVKLCPEQLQEKCFELLFAQYFANQKQTKEPEEGNTTQSNDNSEQAEPESEAIQLRDLHAKVKTFISKGDITLEQLNDIFYKEDGEIKPLYDDLKTKGMSDAQIRLTLLGALQNAISTGNFTIEIEEVRRMCDVHKCYDGKNFTTNFKKNKIFFTEEYKKGVTTLSLSADGKKEVIEVIPQLID